MAAGSDASLEEPKSAFLDLLYKNNCIRTQKKQKVFYWFSVPHDRLFLDALERDLKRERMGTEATTMAVQEPALSFVFDATQSLYEQLTKSMQHNAASEVGASLAAQQAQNNMIAAQYGGNLPNLNYQAAQSYSPQPGPSESYHRRSQSIQSAVPIDYRSHSEMSHSVPYVNATTHHQSDSHRASSYQPNFQGYSMDSQSDMRIRAASYDMSMQSAPYSEHGMNHELMHSGAMHNPGYPSGAPVEFIAPYYEQAPSQQYPDSGFPAPYEIPNSLLTNQTDNLGFHSSPATVPRPMPGNFNMFEGSPTYKQRRRRQSIPTSMLLNEVPPEAPDYRAAAGGRAQTDSCVPRASLGVSEDLRRYDTPRSPLDLNPDYSSYDHATLAQIERSISRTGSDNSAGSPYNTKTYTCPVPACGRFFKRLEHLKRHVRTHTQERPYICELCGKRFSRSDNLTQHHKTHDRSSLSGSSIEFQHYSHGEDYGTYDEMSSYSDTDSTGESGLIKTSSFAARAPTSHPTYNMQQLELDSSRSTQYTDDANLQARLTDHLESSKGSADDVSIDFSNNAYVPSPRLGSLSGMAAPRALTAPEDWNDDDDTPRQDHFQFDGTTSQQTQQHDQQSHQHLQQHQHQRPFDFAYSHNSNRITSGAREEIGGSYSPWTTS